jgi:6-phosphogluconate dehydrogenase
MPGGNKESFESIKHILVKVAAQVPSNLDEKKLESCVTYIGPGGAGNYVKMIHNGIEYGDMELIAEVYDLMKTLGGLDNEKMEKIFKEWNKSELKSFLIEITGKKKLKKKKN